MRKIGLLIAATVVIAGCNYKSTENENRVGDRHGYIMNEPAGGSTKSNAAPPSPVTHPSGSRTPAPSEKTPSSDTNVNSTANP